MAAHAGKKGAISVLRLNNIIGYEYIKRLFYCWHRQLLWRRKSFPCVKTCRSVLCLLVSFGNIYSQPAWLHADRFCFKSPVNVVVAFTADASSFDYRLLWRINHFLHIHEREPVVGKQPRLSLLVLLPCWQFCPWPYLCVGRRSFGKGNGNIIKRITQS